MLSANRELIDTVAFVMAGGEGQRLRPLTDNVPKPLLSFGSVFRILDFTLSNCRNSGVPIAGVLSQYESYQIGHHLRRVWEPNPGCPSFLHLPPPTGKRYRGTADAVRQNLDLALIRGARYALILSADHIYQADYRDLVRFHRDSSADVTISAVRVPVSGAGHFGVLQVGDAGLITSFEEKPLRPRPLHEGPDRVLASMGVYVFSMDILFEALRSGDGRLDDFGHDVLPSLIGRSRVVAWEFQSVGGGSYWRGLGTFEDYQEAQMDFLDDQSGAEFFSSRWPIAAADGVVPGNLESPGRIRDLLNSRVVPGESRIEGSFKRSVLSPGVWIGEDADVQHSVLMQGVHVGAGARVRRAIVGKGVLIPPGERIGYDLRADRSRFYVTDSGLAVVGSQMSFAQCSPSKCRQTGLPGNSSAAIR